MKSLIILICLVLCGCANQPLAHGIPNFAVVDPGVYRGGQPTAEGWRYLHSMGVSNVVKLNLESEGSDRQAEALGMNVYKCPITLVQQLGLSQLWQGTVEADATYMMKPGVFVHCEHGQDRTSLCCAIYRIMADGWTHGAAEDEMMTHGFHKSLLGLWETWEDYRPVHTLGVYQESDREYLTNALVTKVVKRDGNAVLGVYLGMIAERVPGNSVMMFSATSGECLRWISYDEFKAVYVDKTRKEYQ